MRGAHPALEPSLRAGSPSFAEGVGVSGAHRPRPRVLRALTAGSLSYVWPPIIVVTHAITLTSVPSTALHSFSRSTVYGGARVAGNSRAPVKILSSETPRYVVTGHLTLSPSASDTFIDGNPSLTTDRISATKPTRSGSANCKSVEKPPRAAGTGAVSAPPRQGGGRVWPLAGQAAPKAPARTVHQLLTPPCAGVGGESPRRARPRAAARQPEREGNAVDRASFVAGEMGPFAWADGAISQKGHSLQIDSAGSDRVLGRRPDGVQAGHRAVVKAPCTGRRLETSGSGRERSTDPARPTRGSGAWTPDVKRR